MMNISKVVNCFNYQGNVHWNLLLGFHLEAIRIATKKKANANIAEDVGKGEKGPLLTLFTAGGTTMEINVSVPESYKYN